MPEDMNPMIRWIAVDHDFLDTLDIKLASGRDFSPEFSTDQKGAYILNEEAVQTIGWDEPLGKRIEVVEEGPVVGIIEDFHFRSLHHPIEPLALYVWPEGYENYLVRIRAGRTPQALGHMQSVWRDFSPGQAFTYAFLDEAYDNLYSSEIRLSRVFGYVAGISLFVACLGLVGLASFSIERRTKEIGIRKVLGASAPGIAALFAGEFTRWVLIANVVAWPVVFWSMRSWLDNFAYRARLGLPIFLLAGASALLIALLTVGYQAVKAAGADPIESLRYE
jgi:putative ABC transport system permease protein